MKSALLKNAVCDVIYVCSQFSIKWQSDWPLAAPPLHALYCASIEIPCVFICLERNAFQILSCLFLWIISCLMMTTHTCFAVLMCYLHWCCVLPVIYWNLSEKLVKLVNLACKVINHSSYSTDRRTNKYQIENCLSYKYERKDKKK